MKYNGGTATLPETFWKINNEVSNKLAGSGFITSHSDVPPYSRGMGSNEHILTTKAQKIVEILILPKKPLFLPR